MEETRKLVLDLDVNKNWTFAEKIAYRKAVGVNPEYALMKLGEALESEDEADALNVDPAHLLGLLWITERRAEPDLTMDDVVGRSDYLPLLEAVVDWAVEHADPQAAPNRAARRSGTSTRKRTTSRTKSPSTASVSPSSGDAATSST